MVRRTYLVLSQDEQDDMLVQTLLAQERDHCAHQLNLERFEAMLGGLPSGPWRERIQQLRDETVVRLREVESIMEALEPQVPAGTRRTAALTRIRAREQAAQTSRQ